MKEMNAVRVEGAALTYFRLEEKRSREAQGHQNMMTHDKASGPARRHRSVLGAAHRSRNVGPFKAERFAHPLNQARVEFAVRTDEK
jgi:hypothetical protein